MLVGTNRVVQLRKQLMCVLTSFADKRKSADADFLVSVCELSLQVVCPAAN